MCQSIQKQVPNLEHNFLPEGKTVPDLALRQYHVIHNAAYQDSKNLKMEEWEDERRNGLGGSDIASIFGESPFSNNWELFLDKTGIQKKDLCDKWFRLEYGHATESLIAKLFAKKFKAMVMIETGMFKHPAFDFVRANLDRLAILPTGELVILECKSTNYFSRSEWTNGAPVYYAWQGRQYLCVINAILAAENLPPIQKIYYSVLYGNSESDAVFRKITWNRDAERFMLDEECNFWLNHIVLKKLPVFNGKNDALKSIVLENRSEIARLNGVEKPEKECVLDDEAQELFDSILALKDQESKLSKALNALKEKRAGMEAEFAVKMKGADSAILPNGGTASITCKSTRSMDYDALQELYPAAYSDCVTESIGKPTMNLKNAKNSTLKKKAAEKAAEAGAA